MSNAYPGDVATSRKEALALGLKQYYTGTPCKRGHTSPRTVSGGCIECREINHAAWLAEHKDSYNARRRERRAKDPEGSRKAAREYWHRNREHSLGLLRKYYNSDIDRSRARQRRKYQENIEHRRAYARKVQSRRYAKDPVPFKAAAHKSRSKRKRAVPPWFGELDQFVWEEAIALAEQRKISTGLSWHVDHMFPICSPEISGPHVWNNCQVIPAEMNYKKNNRIVFTEPGEWLGALS